MHIKCATLEHLDDFSCSKDCNLLDRILGCCSWDLLKPLSKFPGHNPKCSYYHQDNYCPNTPHVLQFLPLAPSNFSCCLFCMWLSFEIDTFITTVFFGCLSTTTTSGWLAISSVMICIWKSHRNSAWPFTTTFGDIAYLGLVPVRP